MKAYAPHQKKAFAQKGKRKSVKTPSPTTTISKYPKEKPSEFPHIRRELRARLFHRARPEEEEVDSISIG